MKSDKYGGYQWQEKREELIKELKSIFPSNIDDIDNYDFDLILALVVISDWIGSSITIPDNCTIKEMQLLSEDAVTKINFKHDKIIENKSFEDIFDFKPRLFQKEFINIATNNKTYILEAPMGSGKTEAALYASYKQLNKMNGLYFALPTRITSNYIYARVDDFLSKVSPSYDVKLIQSDNNSLLEDYDSSNKDWFATKKKALLAPYGVGTIDQALMSILRVKHHELRKFGLSGKIIIFDEVHSYDVYTSTLLYKLIKELEESGATIIILSATLTKKQIIKLLGTNDSDSTPNIPYPCCMYNDDHKINCLQLDTFISNKVAVELSENDEDIINKAVTAASKGQQVLWIENTVKEAQSIFNKINLKCKSNIETGLIHSRYTAEDRKLNETYWINLYGKDSKSERITKGRILVGTQVLEQSLDIDCDLLITRLAPIDLLFQRMGRLWRHETLNSIRVKDANRKTIILVTPDKKSIRFPLLKGSTSYIYSRYILAKTLEILKKVGSSISIPDDIRPLIESVYEDNLTNDELAFYKQELDKQREKLSTYALLSSNKYGSILPEGLVPTRINDQTKTRILLIQSFEAKEDNFTIYLMSGEIVNLYFSMSENTEDRREKSILLSNQIVETNSKLNFVVNKDLISCLRNYIYISRKSLQLFAVAKVNENDSLRYLDDSSMGLKYNSILGLHKNKEDYNE